MSENIERFEDTSLEDILKVYANVKTWDDLCQTNLDFFDEKINETFYHFGKLNDESLYTPGFLEDLIKLNKKCIFTYNSQPGENTPYCKQKSYLSFCCEYEIGIKLMLKLLANNDLYFMILYYSNINPIYFDNFPEERYNLTNIYGHLHLPGHTEDKWIKGTNWNRWSHIENLSIKEPYLYSCSRRCIGENSLVSTLLLNSIEIFIAHKEYNETFSAPKKLLELISDV